jgi:anti-sigma B factor antagonist
MSAHAVPFRRLRLRSQVTESETVVRCSGRLTTDYAEEFKEEVRKLIPGAKTVVLDFTQLEYMDSSGIGAVVRLYVSAKKENCELRLVNFNQRIRDLLGLSGLLKIFGDCGKYMVRMP